MSLETASFIEIAVNDMLNFKSKKRLSKKCDFMSN